MCISCAHIDAARKDEVVGRVWPNMLIGRVRPNEEANELKLCEESWEVEVLGRGRPNGFENSELKKRSRSLERPNMLLIDAGQTNQVLGRERPNILLSRVRPNKKNKVLWHNELRPKLGRENELRPTIGRVNDLRPKLGRGEN